MVSNFYYSGVYELSGFYYFAWQAGRNKFVPTTTSHDPNPPMTLENEPPAGGAIAPVFNGSICISVIFQGPIVR